MSIKTILVTRPASQGKTLCERLRQQGFNAHSVPVMEIKPLREASEQTRIAQSFARIQKYQGIIVVSLNAAEQTLPWLEHYPLSTETNIFAVGKTTANFLDPSLTNTNKKTIYPAHNMNSEGLLDLPALQPAAVKGKHFLILRGVGGREIIAQTLEERGAQVDSCELYSRYLPEENSTALNQCLPEADMVVINSGESLENLLALTDGSHSETLFDKTLLVPGDRVAAIARRLKFRHIISAANATDDAFIEAILKHPFETSLEDAP